MAYSHKQRSIWVRIPIRRDSIWIGLWLQLYHFSGLRIRVCNGVFTLSDTENKNDSDNENDNYGFYYNMQSTSHCTETDNNTDFH